MKGQVLFVCTTLTRATTWAEKHIAATGLSRCDVVILSAAMNDTSGKPWDTKWHVPAPASPVSEAEYLRVKYGPDDHYWLKD